MDIVVEILLEVYLELMMLIVPERSLKRGHKATAIIVAVIVLCGVVALLIWGAVLIFDYGNLWGIAPISVAALISLAQIIAGILLFNRNHQ